MSIEIPPLNADRLSHPDWGSPFAWERVTLPASRLLGVLESVAGDSEWLEGLQDLAARGASVELFLAADHGALQLALDGRRVSLTGAARDEVLALLEGAPAGADVLAALPHTLLPAVPDASAQARAADVGAQVQAQVEARVEAQEAGASTGSAAPAGPPEHAAALSFGAPLMTTASPEAAAAALERAVCASGLFLESHLAQWIRGERSLQQVRDEVQAMGADLREGEAVDRRATVQLGAAQEQSFALAGPAWPGQGVLLVFEREGEPRREAAGGGEPCVFAATLTLHMRSLGSLCARVRVVQSTVGIRIESEQAAQLRAALPPLAAALAARGMQLAQLSAVSPGEPLA